MCGRVVIVFRGCNCARLADVIGARTRRDCRGRRKSNTADRTAAERHTASHPCAKDQHELEEGQYQVVWRTKRCQLSVLTQTDVVADERVAVAVKRTRCVCVWGQCNGYIQPAKYER